MGKGRIEIKKIENPTNRQVTYSKRRVGIMKKAKELTVLCDAEVSVVMFSSTGKFAEYCSPSTNMKRMTDRYQQVSGIDVWNDQYKEMQNTLRDLEEINRNLRREIRQRMGEDLDGLSVKELRGLEQSLDSSLVNVRERKYHVITTQTDTYKKKVGLLIKSVEYNLDNLKKWMAPSKVSIPLASFPASCKMVSEPLGVVLVLSAWNLPIGLSLEPLIGAISAGNAVVLKPSELAPASSAFLGKTIPKYLDNKAVKVVQGGPQIGEQLLDQKWDKIFFTGNTTVGRMVMTQAAKNLTPVALELGGKCPAIIDSLASSRDTTITVQRIIGGKWGTCSGQACIGIDYMLVEEKFAPTLVKILKEKLMEVFAEPDYAKIINKHHFQRITNLLKDPSVASTIVHGGSSDYENLKIEPTILVDPPLDAGIMTEEIFGPLLPIITLKKIEDSIGFVRARPKPLVIYAFTNDEKLKKKIEEETSSGSVVFNDAMVQYACDTIPFGGVGQCGFGRYHGKFSFDTFSHEKPVLRRSFLIEFGFRYSPWTGYKLQALRHLYKYNYIRVLLTILGLTS